MYQYPVHIDKEIPEDWVDEYKDLLYRFGKLKLELMEVQRKQHVKDFHEAIDKVKSKALVKKMAEGSGIFPQEVIICMPNNTKRAKKMNKEILEFSEDNTQKVALLVTPFCNINLVKEVRRTNNEKKNNLL